MAEPLKESLFTVEMIERLGSAIGDELDGFDPVVFRSAVLDVGWPDRALKQRLRHITVSLHDQIGVEFRDAVEVLRRTLPAITNSGFVSMVPSDYVAVYGLEDWEISIPALEAFTQITSAEFAVRPFINRYGTRMLDQMRAWAHHDDATVRRLASEGSRPRLPWAERVPALIDDPAPIVPILDVLVDDVDGAVRRSVANSLNDVSKDHRELTIAIARRWSVGAGDGRMRTIRHGLRTLIKQGNTEALAILGFGHDPDVVIEATRIEPSTFTIGDAGRFSFTVRSTSRRSQRLEVDYVVAYARRSGRLYEKVWKGRSIDLEPGDSAVITRTVTFANMSTRTIHPGVHLLTPQVNGVRFAATEVLVGEGSAP